MNSTLYFLSIGLLLILNGCAFAAHGRTQMIPFRSAPAGAEVFIDGESKGFTPLTLELRRNQSYKVVLNYHGQKQTVTITHLLESDKVALDVVPAVLGSGFALYVCIDAFSKATESLEAGITGYFYCAGSAALGALLTTPTVVDSVSGSWYYLAPSEIVVEFEP
jgi:hypothetical protein